MLFVLVATTACRILKQAAGLIDQKLRS